MQSLLLALSITLAGQIAPGTPPAATTAQPSATPSRAEIYQAAKKALNEAKSRAMQKDLSLRAKAMQANRDAALKSLCARFSISLAELLDIIDEGEQLDGTASRKQARNSSSKAAAKQRNMAMLGAIGAQLDAQANEMAAQSAAQTAAHQYRITHLLSPEVQAFNSGRSSFGGGGYYYGPRQPPGYYAGGVGSSHKGGHYVNPATGNRYQKSSP